MVIDARTAPRVHIYLGGQLLAGVAEPVATLEGPELRAIGDVSDDGYADLGFTGQDWGPPFAGTLTFYLGGPDGIATTPITVHGLERDLEPVRATIASPVGAGGFHFDLIVLPTGTARPTFGASVLTALR